MTHFEPDDRERQDRELVDQELANPEFADPEFADPELNDLLFADLELQPAAPEESNFDYSALNTLGNRAIALGLLIGHGYHQGQYELLLAATATDPVTPLLLSPREAYGYLKALIPPGDPAPH